MRTTDFRTRNGKCGKKIPGLHRSSKQEIVQSKATTAKNCRLQGRTLVDGGTHRNEKEN